ncbi:TetR/AcrR family transcriptional regulator [Vitiosangium sp. GDMCC 1.1324]|uniref:TetR/AcrR family transcriptional regulator n=1 Tax=Vitiosangium sp. (strain GDMCC 1.1324) TaxID=2138576 RepID=UPI001E3B1A38|nr:TetR/AcrR family transcriptional regulator [Vitiosangium sp. GDMCC 1.1324]
MNEAIVEFSDLSYTEASLSQIARRASIPKGSFYQYFEDKLDLYRWLLTEEAPRRKREFIGAAPPEGDFWARLETFIERGMAFLVEHPRLARLSAAAAAPTAVVEVRGLYKTICEAGIMELRAVLEEGTRDGALEAPDLDIATRFVATVIGPGLTDVILQELGAELHEVLASDSLRKRLNLKRRQALARQAILFIRNGLGSERKSR